MNEENRYVTLLQACYELLKKQNESVYVLNLLEEIVIYDECECDGYCLMQDIEDELLLLGQEQRNEMD